MLWFLIPIAVAAAGVMGYRLGTRAGSRRVADALRTDRDVGVRVMEELARVHGPRLELFQGPSLSGEGERAA